MAETHFTIWIDQNGGLQGSAIGQSELSLQGTYLSGRYETYNHRGAIQCQEPREVAVVYQFKPWGEFFLLGDSDYIIHGFHNGLSLRNSCYLGDVNAALVDVHRSFPGSYVRLSMNGRGVEALLQERECVRWIGSNPEDIECLEEQLVTRLYRLGDCLENEK